VPPNCHSGISDAKLVDSQYYALEVGAGCYLEAVVAKWKAASYWPDITPYGQANKVIASDLVVSVKTVETDRARLMQRLGGTIRGIGDRCRSVPIDART
jgi:hypothetical protein